MERSTWVLTLLAIFVVDVSFIEADRVCRRSDEHVECYHKAPAPAGDFDDKRAECGGGMDGQDLVMIEDAAENIFLQTHLTDLGVTDGNDLWIGKRAVADIRWDQDDTVVGALTWQGVAPTTDTEGVSIEMTEAGVDPAPDRTPDTWEFTAVDPDTATFGYLCEGPAVNSMEDADAEYTIEVGGDQRFFFAFSGTVDRETAKAACEGEDAAWLATIESDDVLLALAAEMDNHAPRPEPEPEGAEAEEDPEIDAQMWIGAYYTDTWRLVNDERVEYFGGEDPLPTQSGTCGYVTYDESGPTMTWSDDGNCATDKEAICEAVVNKADEVCMPEGSCYTLTDTQVTWANANNECESMDGTLAIITDQTEGAFINANLAMLGVSATEELWIGVQVDIGNGPWMWTNAVRTSQLADLDTDFTWRDDSTDVEAEFVASIQYDGGDWGFVRSATTGPYGALCEAESAMEAPFVPISTGDGATSRFYGYHAGNFNWIEARETCRAAGAWLANVGTDTELALIGTALAAETPAITSTMWVGLYRNDWQWSDETPVAYDHWTTGHPLATAGHNGYLMYTGVNSVWRTAAGTVTKIGLCEKGPSDDDADPGDDGLSPGEIAGIAVGCTVVVGAGAGGAGYYAYSKSSGGKVEPNDGGEAGTGEGEKEEDQEGGGEEGEQAEEETPAEE